MNMETITLKLRRLMRRNAYAFGATLVIVATGGIALGYAAGAIARIAVVAAIG